MLHLGIAASGFVIWGALNDVEIVESDLRLKVYMCVFVPGVRGSVNWRIQE